jgi:hypothetical protein
MMIVARKLLRGPMIVVLLGILMFLGISEQASAAEPWWHLSAVSAPAKPAGGESMIVIEASDLGDAYVNGIEHPVTIVDKLPPGITVNHVYPEGGGGEIGQKYTHFFPYTCGVVASTLTCTYGGPLLAYERLTVALRVTFAAGSGDGQNELSVAGGGAASVASRAPLALEGSESLFGPEHYEITPEEEGGSSDTQAGSHPFQLTTTLTLKTDTVPINGKTLAEVQPIALTKDLRFSLPAGLLGNPTAIPQCSIYVFTHQASSKGGFECPPASVIGVATPILSPIKSEAYVPYAYSTPLYNLTPSVGEPAKFGFGSPVGAVVLDTSVRTGGDYGVVVTVPNVTELVGFVGNQVTFWGAPSDPRHDTARGVKCLEKREPPAWEVPCPVSETPPFLIMPTACTGPLHTSIQADSWANPGQFTAPKEYTFQNNAEEPFGLDGCNHLNFEPSISVAPDGQQGSTPTGLTVGVHVPQDASLNPSGLAESTVKDTTVALPTGVGLNPAAADGLQSCSIEQVGLESPEASTCPEAAKVGTVEIASPLLPNPLVGAAYLATQDANPFASLLALYIVAKDPVSGVVVKLAGQVTPDPVTGQLVSTFKETPQLPFEDLKLHFFGGSRAPLGTPALCGSYTTTASIAPWSGNPPVAASSEFQITSGPNGSPCSSPLPFDPSLTSGTTSIQAGGFSPFTTTFSREDGQQNLQSIKLHMPPGLLGTLSHVALCGEPQADQGSCGPESLIGETTVSVGLGGNPYSVTGGKVYITGPYEGAPYGLSIVNPAKAGPFDLGNVIVRAKIEVDPTTAALTITTDTSGPYAIPHILDGIPLQIKHVNVNINRPNFTFNPTNCNKLAITGTLGSSEGSSMALSVPLQVTNCAVLAFKPKLTASTAGKTSKANGASLSVKLAYPAGPYDANIARVKVDLPKQLPSRLTTLQKACTIAQFESNPASCPAASIIGHARAVTPVLPVPLEGPAYFVSHGGEAFPSLIIVLQGYGTTVDLVGSTFISKAGITSSTFKSIPDVPVGTFELTLPEGKYSALAANGNLCTSKLAMPTAFVAQNGAEIDQTTPIGVTGCVKAKAPTRAQKLATALKACKKKAKSKRPACEKTARRQYGSQARKKTKGKHKA